MKTGCKFCGCHFKEDFEKTLEPPCNYWGDKGMDNLPVEIKKKVWEWVFSTPAPDVKHHGKSDFIMDFKAIPEHRSTVFKDMVKNWSELTDDQRKEFQRNYFKEGKGNPYGLPIHYDA